jgi:hypothetical protein
MERNKMANFNQILEQILEVKKPKKSEPTPETLKWMEKIKKMGGTITREDAFSFDATFTDNEKGKDAYFKLVQAGCDATFNSGKLKAFIE